MVCPIPQGDHKKCIGEGLMHVDAWYRGTPEPKFTQFGE